MKLREKLQQDGLLEDEIQSRLEKAEKIIR
jgi:hypothetical protein